jgi:hypothetical protein
MHDEVPNNNNNNNNKHSASITVRRHLTRLPRSDEERTLPLQQLKEIKLYDTKSINARANLATRIRLNKLIAQLQRPFGEQQQQPVAASDVPKSKDCLPQHCDYFVQHGIYRPVSAEEQRRRPTFGWMHVFPVVEIEKSRLRTIHWPWLQNIAVNDSGYIANMPELQHASAFLPAVFSECGAIGDISASFYGLEIGDEARQYYRFRDSEGNLYEMCRMMMGHVLAAEIQHIITCVIAGHPNYVQPQFASSTQLDVWIDNVRYTGERAKVAAEVQRLRETANRVNAAMKVDNPASNYEFIGIAFDHAAHTVRLANKTAKKLPEGHVPAEMRADDIEGLVGRLIFASAVLQRPLINRWWTLKWARRIFNRLNRGLLLPTAAVSIPEAARAALDHWVVEAKTQHKVVRRNNSTRSAPLFTDATLEGWGGVLINDNNEVFVAGGRFPPTRINYGSNIAPHEAAAVDLSLQHFADAIRGIAKLNLFVNNTSVQYGIARGQVRAESLVAPVRSIVARVIDSRVSLLVDYVNTKINPADAISRGERLDVEKVQLAMKASQQNERKGAVVGRFVS